MSTPPSSTPPLLLKCRPPARRLKTEAARLLTSPRRGPTRRETTARKTAHAPQAASLHVTFPSPRLVPSAPPRAGASCGRRRQGSGCTSPPATLTSSRGEAGLTEPFVDILVSVWWSGTLVRLDGLVADGAAADDRALSRVDESALQHRCCRGRACLATRACRT